MLVILLNCVTLGLYQPCNDVPCSSTRCRILEAFDHAIFVYFAVEMCLKMVAMGLVVGGKKAYLGDGWNRLDMFIVLARSVVLLAINIRRSFLPPPLSICLSRDRNNTTVGRFLFRLS